jgi:hypothetical protein
MKRGIWIRIRGKRMRIRNPDFSEGRGVGVRNLMLSGFSLDFIHFFLNLIPENGIKEKNMAIPCGF